VLPPKAAPEAVPDVLVSPLTAAPAEAWEPGSPALVEAGASSVKAWADREAAAVPPETGAFGDATALLDVTEPVPGLPPESPDTATGSLVEMAVASPVFPLLEADELAVEGPELPEVAVGLAVTFESPAEPPLAVPVVALLLPVLDWFGPANAGEAKNRTVVITAAAATNETIDRRCVVSVIYPGPPRLNKLRMLNSIPLGRGRATSRPPPLEDQELSFSTT